MTEREMLGAIKDAYESDRGQELSAAARLDPGKGRALVQALREETDPSGELRRGVLSSQRIAEAEAALLT